MAGASGDTRSAPDRPVDVLVTLDTEGSYLPPDWGIDDAIKEAADVLSEEGVTGSFFFIGDVLDWLRERHRWDVIEAVARHEVGLHGRTDRHPFGAELVQRKSWEDGVQAVLVLEREGAQVVCDLFGRPPCALTAHSCYVTPHLQRAAALLGLPHVYGYPAAPPRYTVSWYAGALGLPAKSPVLPGGPVHRGYFPGFVGRFGDRAAFDERLRALDHHIAACLDEGVPFFLLSTLHPHLLRVDEYTDRFDHPNGVNYPSERWGQYGVPRRHSPAQVRTAIENFRRLVRWIRDDPRLHPTTVAEVARRYGNQPAEIQRDELLSAAQAIRDGSEILLHERFSPAEILVALAQAVVAFDEAGQVPDSVPRVETMGPVRNLPWHTEAQGYTWEAFMGRIREVLGQVAQTGHLPAVLGEPLARVGVNHLYRAVAEAYVAACAGTRLAEVKLRWMRRYPALAEQIGIQYVKDVEGHLMDPDCDVDALYRHGKLQTWTLKPAVIPEP
jgi:peptidoglycan/xylan/chitin deacetylase (PgdA/CDA1 family)